MLLAIATVGTQDLQHQEFESFGERHGLGPKPWVKARDLADLLKAELDAAGDTERAKRLRTYFGDEVVRNGPCFEELDARAPGEWALALLATDQPESTPETYRASDTIGIARLLAEAFTVLRPKVPVLGPFAITAQPANLSEELDHQISTAIETAVRELREQGRTVDELVALTVGGTPAMRVATERAVALRPVPSRVLLPDPDTRGTHDRALTRLLIADVVRARIEHGVLDAARAARFRQARDTLDTLGALVEPTTPTGTARVACDIGMRVLDGEVPWVTNAMHAQGGIPDEIWQLELRRRADPIAMALAARIEEVRLAGKDRRRRDAAIGWVTVAELFPLLWVSRRLTDGERPADVAAAGGHLRRLAGASCGRSDRRVHLPEPGRDEPQLLARAAADCATRPCGACPLRADHALVDDREGAELALAMRHGSGAAQMLRLRNRWVHGLHQEATSEADSAFRDAIAKAHQAIPGYRGSDGVAEGLRFVFEGLCGAPPPVVLGTIAKVVADALNHPDR
ncbi:MAG: hypothetical protein WHS89_12335 [Acidimicrobiales bacterium]